VCTAWRWQLASLRRLLHSDSQDIHITCNSWTSHNQINRLKPKRYNMYHQVEHSEILFPAHNNIFTCFWWISEQRAIIRFYNRGRECFNIKTNNPVSVYALHILTLILLTWRIWWAPNNARIWQMGFNSAFKGLNKKIREYGSIEQDIEILKPCNKGVKINI